MFATSPTASRSCGTTRGWWWSSTSTACHGNQHLLDMRRLVPDLGVCEPERDETGCGVDLVAQPVARLLGGRAVVAEAIRLDDQAQVGPVEVDLEAVHIHLRQRLR